jgi:MoaA/NifB/PqqE/SkfB family radical SAM enzyme
MIAPIEFDHEQQHFRQSGEEITIPEYPLTVTLQVTRKCNLRCVYCSEPEQIPEPSLKELEHMIGNLRGVKRIIVSGGEPTLRSDLLSILKTCSKTFEIVALSSNGTLIDWAMARGLLKYVDYVDVTIDGPRKIHDGMRGSYDEVIAALRTLNHVGMEFSIVMVLLQDNKEYISYVAQTSDVLGAKKMKILAPIPKGRGKDVQSKTLTSQEINELFDTLRKQKQAAGWNVRITMTDWKRIKEGHALLIHPDGDVVASPVWSNPLCVERVGSVMKENIKDVWSRYRFKENHVRKYIERSLLVC